MHHLEQDGNRRAGLVNRLLTNKERLIGAILLGNNAVNILASSLATSVLIGVLGDAGVAVATLGMTLLLLIFAEILPKTYAIRNADRVALAVARPLRAVVAVLAPFTIAIQWLIRRIARLVGLRLDGGSTMVSADDLRGAISLYAKEGEGIKHEKDMLASILDLADVEVGEIMVHRKNMETIDGDQPSAAIIAQIVNSPYTRLPLWRGDPDNIVGVLHAKDVLRAVRAHKGDLDALDVSSLARPPWFIPDTTTLRDQLHAFRVRRAHFALVVDEYGALMGLVTLEDILEEIVGEIADEHDVTVAGIVAEPDGTYLVDGTVTIRDINREFEWRLPDEEASTIAGLVIHEAKLIPEVGQRFVFHGIGFEVLRRHRNQVTKLRMTPPEHLNRAAKD